MDVLQYQWHKNGEAITGATGDAYLISEVDENDYGNYSVRVQNNLGKVDSKVAELKPGILIPGDLIWEYKAGGIMHVFL